MVATAGTHDPRAHTSPHAGCSLCFEAVARDEHTAAFTYNYANTAAANCCHPERSRNVDSGEQTCARAAAAGVATPVNSSTPLRVTEALFNMTVAGL